MTDILVINFQSQRVFVTEVDNQVVQTRAHCQKLLIPDYTYLDNNIPPAHKMTSDPWLQSFTVLMP